MKSVLFSTPMHEVNKLEPKEDPSSALPEDYWGILDFNPNFIGEYRVNDLSFMKL